MENYNQSKYVKLSDGKVIPRHLLKVVRKNLFQGGQEQTQYEVDEIAVMNMLLKFGSFDSR